MEGLGVRPGPAGIVRVDPEQPVQRDLELQLAAEVDDPRELLVRAVRDPVDRPRRGHLDDDEGAEGEPLLVEPEDQQADVLAVGRLQRCGEEPGPVGEVARRRGTVEEADRRRGEDRAVPAVDVLLQLGTGPVAGDPDPVPAASPEADRDRVGRRPARGCFSW